MRVSAEGDGADAVLRRRWSSPRALVRRHRAIAAGDPPDQVAVVRPTYAAGSLADVLPSVAAGLGVARPPRPARAPASAQVPSSCSSTASAGSCCRRTRDAAPFLVAAGRAGRRRSPSASRRRPPPRWRRSAPAQPPGRHGLVGYTFALPEDDGRCSTRCAGTRTADPLDVQPQPTVFERARRRRRRRPTSALRHFDGSGLTRAALRGARTSAPTPGRGRAGHRAEATAGQRPLARVRLHRRPRQRRAPARLRVRRAGARSSQHVDLLARHLLAELPPDGLLLVTADHGMVDVGPGDRVDFDTRAAAVRRGPGARRRAAGPARLRAARRGRRRARRLAGAARADARRCCRATRRSRRGWFGRGVAARCCRASATCVAGAAGRECGGRRPQPLAGGALVGYHGSTTDAEVLVPLLVARP